MIYVARPCAKGLSKALSCLYNKAANPPPRQKLHKMLIQNYKEKSFLDPCTCSQDRAPWTHSVTGSQSLPLGFNPRIWFGFPVFPQFPPTVTEYKNRLHYNTLSLFFPGGCLWLTLAPDVIFQTSFTDIFWFLLTTHHFCVQLCTFTEDR